MKSWLGLLAATAGLATAGGAYSQLPGGRDAEHRRGRPQSHAGLFISPSGRPYRAGAGEPDPVATWFSETDTDHDGYLERSEFRAEAAAFFKDLDVDHDGVIEPDEVDIYEQRIAPEILRGRPARQASAPAQLILAQYGGAGGGGRSHGGRHGNSSTRPTPDAPQTEMVGAAPYNFFAEPEPVTAADTRFNGRITLDEFVAAADRHFDALDVHQNGRIAFSDLPKTQAQISGSRTRSPHNEGS